MNTRTLLLALMAVSKQNPTSLAKALKGSVKQPQIFKFLKGVTTEPRRSTLSPIADYYGINVEAFFNESLAQELLAQLNAGNLVFHKQLRSKRFASEEPPQTRLTVSAHSIEQMIALLADRIDEIGDPQQREQIAVQLQTLARAPDSQKARHGLLQAFDNHNTNAPLPPPAIGGVAGAVLDKKLVTESRDIFKRDQKNNA